MAVASRLHSVVAPLTTQLLTDEYEAEVLAFLAERPLHTVGMAGLILENGLTSPLNRGDFYACRDASGELEGVALIGHATLIEAHSDEALEAFAQLARNNSRAHLIRGEQEMIERFLDYYTPTGYLPRLVSREVLFEQKQSVMRDEPVGHLRPATLNDLEQVMAVNAAMIYEECGVNPLQTDLAGFSQRTARRIEQGRIWVWMEDGRLIFKTDIMSDTPEVIYLEGVYVNPTERGTGLGRRSMTRLGSELLLRTRRVCLLANEENERSHAFYRNCGYKLRGLYDTIFLRLD